MPLSYSIFLHINCMLNINNEYAKFRNDDKIYANSANIFGSTIISIINQLMESYIDLYII